MLLPALTFTTSLDSGAILSTSDLELSYHAFKSYLVPNITSGQEEVLRGWMVESAVVVAAPLATQVGLQQAH